LGGALIVTAGAVSLSRGDARADVAAPGVVAGGIALGGKSDAEVRAALEDLAHSLPKRTLTLAAASREVRVGLDELGATLDVDATARAAMEAGRASGLEGALRTVSRARSEVPLEIRLDDAAVRELAVEWERALVEDPPFDGAIEIEDGAPVARKPRAGHRIDVEALAGLIKAELRRGGGGPVRAPLVEIIPPIADAEVERAHDLAEAILSGPITLEYVPTEEQIAQVRAENEDAEKRRKEAEARAKWRLPKKKSRMQRKGRRLVEEPAVPKRPSELPVPEAVTVTFSREDLLAAFRARRSDEPSPHFVVELDDAEVKRKLVPVVARLMNPARDARFELDGEGRISIVPSRPGTRVDTSKLVDALYAAAQTPDRRGELPVDKDAQPKFTTEDARALGIKGLVAEYTTHHPCCQGRVKNIHRIADMIDGTIVKPGETFSVNAAVGPRTLERGFVLAPSIGDGEMVDTPGGGVSQFATTLYNALFDGGYSIKERKPHSYYFNRYPVGIEATLSYPSPDLAFYNDTDAAVLIRCEYGDTYIKVRLFGDNGGRRIERRVSQAFDFTDPKVEYEPNPRREPDDDKVKESGSNGFSVTTTRVITFADGTKREERRLIKYAGRPRVLEVHPCRIPKGEKGHTGDKCPEKEETEESTVAPAGTEP
jgi:vancomycin resistance protein YoaR